MDSISAQLLAGAVTDATNVRNDAEAKGDLVTVSAMERILMRLVTVEARLEGPVTYRVRQ